MNETIVTLNGWVGSEVEVHDAGGQALATFRVASTSRRRKGDEWVDGTTTWFKVKAWRRLAGHVKESLRVGDPVIITGHLEADVWVREDGTSSTQLVVTATSAGHDLARGTSLYTKPGRTDGQPVGGDPWGPAAAAPTSEEALDGSRTVEAAEGAGELEEAGPEAA
jgi:single-strand DNA-binding protein